TCLRGRDRGGDRRGGGRDRGRCRLWSTDRRTGGQEVVADEGNEQDGCSSDRKFGVDVHEGPPSEAPCESSRVTGDPLLDDVEDVVGCGEAVIGEVVTEHELDVGLTVHTAEPPTTVARASASMAARMAR